MAQLHSFVINENSTVDYVLSWEDFVDLFHLTSIPECLCLVFCFSYKMVETLGVSQDDDI